jgi:hypothetical protein
MMTTSLRLTMTLISKKLRRVVSKSQSRSAKMNKEFVEKNYEIALLASIFLYIIFPVYIVLFLICSVVALGRGQLYTERLREFLKTLSDIPAVETEMPPIARTRSNRKRRGSFS